MNAPLRRPEDGALSTEAPVRFRRQRRPEERVEVLGAQVDLVRPEEVLWFTAQQIAAGKRAIVANHNLHSLYLLRREPRVAEFFRKADLIEVDSTPLIHWARLIGRPSRPFHRCTYLDWRELFWDQAVANGWRVFYLGGAPGVAETAAERPRARYPGVNLAVHDGYFDAAPGSAGNAAVVDQIRAFDPQVLFVGMGMPRQEIWIADNAEALNPCVMFSVGAAFDYEAGVQSAAPRWMGRAGVEWLYRLLHDPRRLFQRYCVEPWFLVPSAFADLGRRFARRS
ncbi:MAG: glycosyltransferase [Caulobacterales bacterium 68-7]|nr:MAG: glycosyltransferase [Caulobacterales bacterium 68-7]